MHFIGIAFEKHGRVCEDLPFCRSKNRTGRKRKHPQLSRATAGSTGCNPDSLSTAGSRVSFTISSTPCLVRNWWEPDDSVVAHLLWVKWHEIATKSSKMHKISACSIIQHPLLLRLGRNTSFAVLLLSLLSATAINTSTPQQTSEQSVPKCYDTSTSEMMQDTAVPSCFKL